MDRLELAWLVRGMGILSLLVIAVGVAMPRPDVSAEAKKALGALGFHGPSWLSAAFCSSPALSAC